MASRFIRATLNESLEKNNKGTAQEKQNISSFRELLLFERFFQFRCFLIFSPTVPLSCDSFFLVQTIITTTLAPRGAGVGLLSLRRARFARRGRMLSPSFSHARADFPAQSVRSLRAAPPS